MMTTFAPRITYSTLVTPLTVESGLPIRVFHMLFANSSGAATGFTIANATGTTLGTVWVPTKDTRMVIVPFLADQGLKITALTPGADQEVTIHHTNSGS